MAKFCTNCGNPLSGNEKFCTKCGYKITDLSIQNQGNGPQKAESDQQADESFISAPEYPVERTSSRKNKYLAIGIPIVIIIIFFAVWALILNRNSDNSAAKEVEMVEDTIESESLLAADEKKSDQRELRVYNDVNSLMRYVGSNPSGYSIRKMGKDWNWKTGGSEGDALVFGEGYLGLSAVRIVGYVTPDGYIYGRYYGSNGIQLDVNGFVDEDCELRIQLGHGGEASYMRLIEDADFDNVYTGAWGEGNKTVGLLFNYKDTYYSDNPADFSNFDNNRLDGHGIMPTDASYYDLEVEEYQGHVNI